MELAEKATPRPWTVKRRRSSDGGVKLEYRYIPQLDGATGLFLNFPESDPEGRQSRANYDYIVAAANAVPRLIAEKERLLDQRDKALARVEALRTALLNVYCLRSTRRLMSITCDDRPDEGKCHVCAALAADDAAKKSSDV